MMQEECLDRYSKVRFCTANFRFHCLSAGTKKTNLSEECIRISERRLGDNNHAIYVIKITLMVPILAPRDTMLENMLQVSKVAVLRKKCDNYVEWMHFSPPDEARKFIHRVSKTIAPTINGTRGNGQNLSRRWYRDRAATFPSDRNCASKTRGGRHVPT